MQEANKDKAREFKADFVVIGGGISGVICAERLAHLCAEERDGEPCVEQQGYLREASSSKRRKQNRSSKTVILLTATPLLKCVTNHRNVSRTLEEFDVVEQDIDSYFQKLKRPKGDSDAHCSSDTSVKKSKREFFKDYHHLRIIHSVVTKIDFKKRIVEDSLRRRFEYGKLCLCTGARPREIQNMAMENETTIKERLLHIRDTETAVDLERRLSTARKVCLIGNGGIAMELVHEIRNCEVVWVIKDKAIGWNYFDPGASQFFSDFIRKKSSLLQRAPEGERANNPSNTDGTAVYEFDRFHVAPSRNEIVEHAKLSTSIQGPGGAGSSRHFGSSLGPLWAAELRLNGNQDMATIQSIVVEKECIVKSIESAKNELKSKDGDQHEINYPLCVVLSSGARIKCDYVISAIGVEPCTDFVPLDSLQKLDNVCTGLKAGYTFDKPIVIGQDGGIVVNLQMQSVGDPNVYAAGDCCSCDLWETLSNFQSDSGPSKLFFQMRLWNQARHMGFYAAQSMFMHTKTELLEANNNHNLVSSNDFYFELFSHTTRFFGFKVILLGLYNWRTMADDMPVNAIVRVNEDKEYIKLCVCEGRIVGAVLVGDTGLEEMIENLILNQTDVSQYGETLLDPNIDIEDFFD
eukprot:Nk52_evm40s1737 gene=Nk52_evmTU40s1737